MASLRTCLFAAAALLVITGKAEFLRKTAADDSVVTEDQGIQSKDKTKAAINQMIAALSMDSSEDVQASSGATDASSGEGAEASSDTKDAAVSGGGVKAASSTKDVDGDSEDFSDQGSEESSDNDADSEFTNQEESDETGQDSDYDYNDGTVDDTEDAASEDSTTVDDEAADVFRRGRQRR